MYHTDQQATWHTQTILYQLGNIGAEAGRAIQAFTRGDSQGLDSIWSRLDELFVLSIADPRWHRTRRLREILYAREVTYSFLMGENPYRETAQSLERYWMEWGISANEERKRNRRSQKARIGNP